MNVEAIASALFFDFDGDKILVSESQTEYKQAECESDRASGRA